MVDRSPQIGIVACEHHRRALELLFGRLDAAERRRQIDEALKTGRLGETGGSELIGAWRGGRLVGAMFLQFATGRTVAVWLPRLNVGESESTAAALLDLGCRRLDEQDVAVAHVRLDTVDPSEEALLRRGGFVYLADLIYFVSQPTRFCTTPPQGDLQFEPYSEISHRRLIEIIAATYEATLDVPLLKDARDMEDVLAGYRDAGAFDPRNWLIVRHARRDVGCLLLADHPRQDNLELLYLGLMTAARGHGWGKQIVRQAQWLAGRAGRARLVTAVDAANVPAVRTYSACDFQPWQRRKLFVRRFAAQ